MALEASGETTHCQPAAPLPKPRFDHEVGAATLFRIGDLQREDLELLNNPTSASEPCIAKTSSF